MSALEKPAEILTPEEYLEMERAAEERSEYVNGIVVAMAGGTFEHDIIAGNIQRSLGTQLRDRPCYAFTANMKVRIDRANVFRYPDASALCGPVLFHDQTRDAYCNPGLIVEVLSPGTERYDRTDKFALYRMLDSFTEYLLVAQDRREAQLFRKQPDERWTEQTFTQPEEIVVLESIASSLHLSDIYDKVEGPGSHG
ncbi:MAG: Uma2 family endonuclease [Chthoniobacteraceae bacterium]